MPKLKNLSGEEVVHIFKSLGFSITGQRGSHVKLQRTRKDNTKQTLTIPLHKELDKGTTKAIYNQAVRYIPEDDLHKHFYTN